MPIGHISQDPRQQQQEAQPSNPYQAKQGEALTVQAGYVGPLPKATQRNWLATCKAKEVAGTSKALTPSQPVKTQSTQSPTSPIPPSTEHTKY